MHDELVKRLREFASIPEHCENVADCDKCTKEEICLSFTNKRIIEVTAQAADAIEELSVVVRAQKAVLDKFHSWIPVAERLPEIGTYIIAGRMKYDYEKTYTHFVDVAYFGPRWNDVDYSWQTFNDWFEGQQEFEITHWMPLPESPKEET